MVVLFQQYAENRDFFSNFFADGLHNWDTLLVIPLEFQEIKHQPCTLTEPKNKILRLCQSTWLFCFSNILKIYAFSPIFRWWAL